MGVFTKLQEKMDQSNRRPDEIASLIEEIKEMAACCRGIVRQAEVMMHPQTIEGLRKAHKEALDLLDQMARRIGYVREGIDEMYAEKLRTIVAKKD